MTIRSQRNSAGSRPGQRGMSLVELMIGITLSSLLIGGVIQIFASTKQTYNLTDAMGRLQENARYAFDRMNEDLGAAGYMGCTDSASTLADGNLAMVNALNNPGSDIAIDFANPISGDENLGGTGNDRLSIRRAITGSAVPLAAPMTNQFAPLELDSTHPNYASLEQYQIMSVSDCHTASVFMITNDPTSSGGVIRHDPGVVSPAGSINEGVSNLTTAIGATDYNDLKTTYGSDTSSAARTFRVATNTYAIQPGTDTGSNGLFVNGEELVEYVDSMQVLYGIDNDGTDGVEQYVDADNIPASPGVDVVHSVQVTLTLRAGTLQVNGAPVTKSFTHTFRLRNR